MHKSCARRGVSLVEALVGLTILVAVMIPVVGLLQNASHQMVASRYQLVAEQLGEAFLEAYPGARAVFADSVAGDPLSHKDARALLTGGSRTVEEVLAAGRYTMRVDVERGAGGHASLARLTARLEWEEGSRHTSRTFARLVIL